MKKPSQTQHVLDPNPNFKDVSSVSIKKIWGVLKSEPAYFWWLCIYIFFEYVRPQTAYPILTILPWSFLALGLTLFTWFTSKNRKIPSSPLTGPITILFISILISATFSYFPAWSRHYIDIPINWFLLYILFISIVTTKNRLFIVVLLLMLASFKMSQHASISWIQRGFAFARWGIAGGQGWFGNAADLGVQLCIFVPLAFYFYVSFNSNWGKFKKLFFMSFFITGILGIIATGERGTLLGLVAMGIFSILASKKRFKSLILLFVVSAIVYSIIPQQFLDRFENMGEDKTSKSRLLYWGHGLEMFNENPVIGIGYYNWVPYYKQKYPGESLRGEKQEVAHSAPITVLAELGSIGFLTYYFIVLKIYLVNRRIIKSEDENPDIFISNLARALNIGLIGFIVTSMVVSVQYYPFLWVQACLTASLDILQKQQKNEPLKNS